DFEGERGRVDVMILAVDQGDLEVNHREASNHARTENRLKPLLDAGNEFFRYRTADDIVFELERRAGLRRLGGNLDLRELTGAAGLLLVRVAVLNAVRDLFAECHLRRTNIGINFVSALENVDLDVEVKLAHALQDRLTTLLIGRDAE